MLSLVLSRSRTPDSIGGWAWRILQDNHIDNHECSCQDLLSIMTSMLD